MKQVLVLILSCISLHVCLADTVYSKDMEDKANHGDAFAQAQLGYCYIVGSGVEKDFNKAFEWFGKSASRGNAYSMYFLGRNYLYGEGTEVDAYESVRWFEKSYSNGYEQAKEYLDKFALPEEIYGYRLIELAEGDDVEAQYALATFLWTEMNMKGIYKVKDDEKAFYWMSKAAECGNLNALHDLAIFYLGGFGTEKDEKEGARCFQMAADKGSKSAQHQLGLCYSKGIGVEKDDLKALFWINTAAQNGYNKSMFELGYIYQHGGLGLSPDIDKAIEWYKKGAKAKSGNAMVNLGYCYENGIGVEKDFWKAVELYGEASQLGNEIAQQNITVMAKDIKKKFPKHFKDKKVEAINGDIKAQAMIAAYYLGNSPQIYGIDALDPLTEASKWILTAAENGYSDFYYIAGEIYETGELSCVQMDSNYKLTFSSPKNVRPIDLTKAKTFYERAVNSDAENRWIPMYKLGKSYYTGEALVGEINYNKCVEYLLPLIDYLENEAPGCTELKEAYEIMSKCYRNGRGVEANEEKADMMMKKSIQLGNTLPWEKEVMGSWALD